MLSVVALCETAFDIYSFAVPFDRHTYTFVVDVERATNEYFSSDFACMSARKHQTGRICWNWIIEYLKFWQLWSSIPFRSTRTSRRPLSLFDIISSVFNRIRLKCRTFCVRFVMIRSCNWTTMSLQLDVVICFIKNASLDGIVGKHIFCRMKNQGKTFFLCQNAIGRQNTIQLLLQIKWLSRMSHGSQ